MLATNNTVTYVLILKNGAFMLHRLDFYEEHHNEAENPPCHFDRHDCGMPSMGRAAGNLAGKT